MSLEYGQLTEDYGKLLREDRQLRAELAAVTAERDRLRTVLEETPGTVDWLARQLREGYQSTRFDFYSDQAKALLAALRSLAPSPSPGGDR